MLVFLLIIFGTCSGWINVTVTRNHALCFGQLGDIKLDVQGDNPPFRIQWTDLQGLVPPERKARAGKYHYVVVDSARFRADGDVVIKEPKEMKEEMVVRTPKCFGEWGHIDFYIHGGAPPYRFTWQSDAPGSTEIASQHAFVSHGNHTVKVWDKNGCFFSRVVTIKQPDKLSIKQVCHEGRFVIAGGVTPYDIRTDSVSFVNVTDANGCFSSLKMVPRGNPLSVSMTVTQSVLEGKYNTGTLVAVVSGGTLPLLLRWENETVERISFREVSANSEIATDLVLRKRDFLEVGTYSLKVEDAFGCTKEVNVEMTRVGTDPCGSVLSACLSRRSYSSSLYYPHCLRKIASDILWNPEKWDLCGARAVHLLAQQLSMGSHHTVYLDAQFGANDGAIFLTLLLGRALAHCKQNVGVSFFSLYDKCEMNYRVLEPLLSLRSDISSFFSSFVSGDNPGSDIISSYSFFFNRAFARLLNADSSEESFWVINNQISFHFDVIMFGPYGFNNEPIFAPIMASSAVIHKLRVGAVLLNKFGFSSSLVPQLYFPWTLQVDVELSALFLKHILLLTTPKYVWPSDSAAVLIISWLSVYKAEEKFVQDHLLRSIPQHPAEYPPPCLGKLFKEREGMTPREFVVSEDDGLRFIFPNISFVMEKIRQNFKSAPIIFKREFSEAGRGVAMVYFEDSPIGEERLIRSLETVWPRGIGMGQMDLNIKVKIFVQEQVLANGAEPKHFGFRFFAVNGKVLAAHTSITHQRRQMQYGGLRSVLSYITVRDEECERKSLLMLERMNYTGFGNIWFMESITADTRELQMIDFNPRFERQQCFSFANFTHADPCVAFVLWATNASFSQPPYFFPEGVTYQDPTRMLDFMNAVLVIPGAVWNLEKRDTKMFQIAMRRIEGSYIEE